MGTLRRGFKNLSNEFRPVPFWAWNDDLNEQELVSQIKKMQAKGIGGFFMHSRVGLITPYLSAQWMNKIKKCVQEAKNTHMDAWLYDEDRWPSGFAGGIVPAKGSEYRMKAIEFMEIKSFDTLECLLKENPPMKIFACDKRKGKPVNLEDITYKKVNAAQLKGRSILYFSVIYAPDTPWHNGYGYSDTLNPEAVGAFIKSTYEAYYKEVGDEFDKTIPGIFTDEPNYLDFHGYIGEGVLIPWTEKFSKYFQNKKGYNILESLPSLFYEVGDFHKIRYDYWSTVTELFVESFSKQLYRWCDNHSLKLTGHYLAEDTLNSQVVVIGSAMPHYEYMHVPGIDHLGRNIQDLITVKQVSSVAHQLGKERVLSETYACSGWDLSFEDQKWIGDWQYVLGVNLLNKSMFLYSLRGCRKRDFPPSISYQQPWWQYNKFVADYFTRLGYVLTQGEFVSDIIVIHPIGSAWCIYDPAEYTERLRAFFVTSRDANIREGLSEVDQLNNRFAWLSKTLCGLHRDYDFGDELLMKKYAKIEDGTLVVGNHSYRVVIIPPGINLAKNTFDLIKDFIANEGKIIAIKPLPHLIEGEFSDELEDIFKTATVIELNQIQLKEALDNVLAPDVQIIGKDGEDTESVYYQHRRINNTHIFFFANTDRKKSYDTLIRVKEKGKLEEWDLENGKIMSFTGEFKNGYTSFGLYFSPVQSHLIVLDSEDRLRPVALRREILSEVIRLPQEWKFERLGPNALTLDYCSYKIGDGEFSAMVPVWKAQSELSVRYGIEDRRGNDGIQFWRAYQKTKEIKEKVGFHIKYVFCVRFNINKKRRIFLILETPEKFKLQVNREKVEYRDTGWWIDLSFKKIDISRLVLEGSNEIVLSIVPASEIKEPLELESCYIIGDFGVKHEDNHKFFLGAEKEKLLKGNLVNQGYPFYAGTVAYTQEVEIYYSKDEKIFLELENAKATVARVLINDREAGLLCWHPYRLDVTDFIKNGMNQIRIELTNSLRNLLGPHHHKDGELLWVGPGHFSDEDNWTDRYSFVKFGLLGDVKILRYKKE